MDRRPKRYSFSNSDQCSYQFPKHQSKPKDYIHFNEYPSIENRFYKPQNSSPIDHRNSFIQLPSFGDCHIISSIQKKQQHRYDQFQYRSRQMDNPDRKRNRVQTSNDYQSRQHRRQSIQSDCNFSKSWNKPISGEMRNEKLKEISEIRAVNIDKINMKIKNILDKLNQEENRNNIFAKKVQNYKEKSYPRQNQNHQHPKFTNFDSFKYDHNLHQEKQQLAYKNQHRELVPLQNHKFNCKPKTEFKQYKNDSYFYEREVSKRWALTPSKPKITNDPSIKKYTQMESPNSEYKINNYQFEEYQRKNEKSDYHKPLKATFDPQCYNNSLSMKNIHIRSEKRQFNNSISSDTVSNQIAYTGPKRSQIWSSDKNRLENNQREKTINRSFILNRGQETGQKNIKKSSLFDRSSNNSRQHSLILKNGKNLDNEIQRIQEKMQKLEKIKQELNLNMKDGQIEVNNQQKSKISTPFQINEHLFKQKKQEVKALEEQNFSDKKRQLKDVSNKISVNRQKQYFVKKNQQIAVPKPFQMVKNKQTKRLDSLDTSQNHRFINQKLCQSSKDSEQFHIPKHIPLPQSSDIPRSSANLKKLISILNSQIELDSQFRNTKKWFENLSSAYKWKELKLQLAQSIDRQFNQQQVKDIFTLQEDQNNPFHSVRQSDGSIKLLIQAFLKAEEHWHRHIQGQFMKQKLIQEGFTVKNIDLDRKGTITVEDFLRFINFQANTFFRIRDVTLIFKRITSSYEVDFDSLIQTFCKSTDTQEIYSLSSKRSNFMLL